MADEVLRQVMEFITQNRLDERAAEALLSCPLEIQQTVVARGDLYGMNNPSSAVLGRIRQVKMRHEAEVLRVGGNFGYGEHQVEEFIQNNSLDDRAADGLRNAGADIQYAVMSRGNLHDARNPSSALLGRLKEAQQKGVGRGYGVLQRVVDDALVATIQTFALSNSLDERAVDALMNSPTDVVQHVVSRGSLADAKNPSSAVLGRIKDAKAAGYGQTQQLIPADSMLGSGFTPGAGFTVGFGASMLSGQQLDDAVEKFIADGGVNERASQAFRCTDDAVKRWIIGKGTVRDARNPSSALLARIKDGNNKMNEGTLAPPGALLGAAAQLGMPIYEMAAQAQHQAALSNVPFEQELQWFIQGSGIDDRATEALLCQTIEVQRAVVARGSLADARNPSSAVLGRIKDANAELSIYGTTSSAPSHWPTQTMASVMVPNPIQEFCEEYKLDERAIEALLSSPPEVQSMVLAGGGLQTARNPSSAVLGRIKEAQAKLGLTGPEKNQGLKTDFSAAAAAAAASGSVPWVPFSSAATVEDRMEEFIANNQIDERAAQAFRCCAPEVALAVMNRGELRDTRNPSSAILGRIKDAQAAVGWSPGGGGSGSTAPVQDWFERSTPVMERLMEPTSAQDWNAPRSSQDWFERSSPAMSRSMDHELGAVKDDIEGFIIENTLDERAAELLRMTAPEVQAAVMARGTLRDARNPSSAVLGRIKDAQMTLKQQQQQQQQSWGGGSAAGSNQPGLAGEVDEFIQENNIDSRAADALRAAPPDVQHAVLERGGLQDARNPSSAVLGRLRDANAAYRSAQKGEEERGSRRFRPY